jgi:hypothetical protein
VSTTGYVALAATIGGPSVAALAIGVGALNSKGERRHARELARSTRWFDTRRQVYEELLRYMHHAMLRADRIEPIITTNPPGPDAPEPMPEVEALQVQVRATIFGSREVKDAAEEFMSKIRGFHFYAGMRANDQARGATAMDSTREMNSYRDQASALLKKVETMMRDELETL